MAKVERYEAKLSVMAYIGLFDELLRSVIPVCIAITRFFYSLFAIFKYHRTNISILINKTNFELVNFSELSLMVQ